MSLNGLKRCELTIVMTTYNRANLLRDNLSNLLRSDYNFELLILNDASADNTDDVVNTFHDDRIAYIKNSTNIGYAANMNKGIDLAKNSWVFFCEDDAFIQDPNGFFMTMMNEMNSEFIIGTHLIQKKKGVWYDSKNSLKKFLEFFTKDIILYNGDKKKIVDYCNNCFAFNKDVIKLKFDEIKFKKRAHRIESDFQIRARKAGFKIIYNPDLAIDHKHLKSGGLPEYTLYPRMINNIVFIDEYYSKWNIFCYVILMILSHIFSLNIIYRVVNDYLKHNL